MIKYDPKKLIREFAPASKIKKLITKGATLKRSALSFVNDISFIDKKDVASTALKTIKDYKKRIEAETVTKAALTNDPKQLIQRVQNSIIFQIQEKIKTKYNGISYIWLPSEAKEPDPQHQLNYGKTFQIGVGEMPGERYGCLCGMQILTDDSTLKL